MSGQPIGDHRSELLSVEESSFDRITRYAESQRLWAVLDACDTPIVVQKAQELGPGKVCCLFKGKAAEFHAESAPFLARADKQVVDWIREVLWTQPWGVFAVSSVGLAEMRDHLRGLLIVEDPDGQQKYFRYYDPRVMETFLPCGNDDQLEELFGPVEAYVTAGASLEEEHVTSWTFTPKE